MKSSSPKELITFAQQLHDSVSKLAHGKEVSELSSKGNIRFMMMKLTPHLQVKGGAKCYDALPRVLNLVDMDDWLTKKSKRQQYGKLLCGGVSNESNDSSNQQPKTKKGKGKPQPATSTINHVETSSSSPTKTTTTAPASTTKPVKTSLPPPICYVCKDVKHYIIECPT